MCRPIDDGKVVCTFVREVNMRLLGALVNEVRSRLFLRDVYAGIPVARVGEPIPWKPTHWLWPDGTERTTPPPRT